MQHKNKSCIRKQIVLEIDKLYLINVKRISATYSKEFLKALIEKLQTTKHRYKRIEENFAKRWIFSSKNSYFRG